MSSNVTSLFQTATQENDLSAAAFQTLSAPDVGQQIANALTGSFNVDDVSASEVLLVGILVDDSGSIRFVQGNTEAVRQGHNGVLDALGGSKQKDAILAHCRYLNGRVLYPFGMLNASVRMDSSNYNPNEGTPLYDQSVVFLGTVLAKAQEFKDNGVQARTASLIITDGADLHSYRNSAKDVAKIVRDMLRQETHIVAGMGIADNQGTDFHYVFQEMGIQNEWILTPGNTPSEIRKAFQVFSQSAVRASQNAGSFSQVAMGGFGG